MKKLLTIAVMAGAMSAMAVESSNTFGILRVDSSAPETIVSIPWLAAGGSNIKVKDVVKTANLTVGDKLYYYDGENYKMWALTANGWEGANIVKNNNVIENSKGGNETLARGGAIILVRQNPTSGTPAVANPFYLYGQYAAITAGDKTTLPNGAMSLIAPPMTENINITSMTWENVGPKDKILIPSGTPGLVGEIIRNKANDAWVTMQFNQPDSTHPLGSWSEVEVTYAIPAGQGVWFKSGRAADSAETAATVTWVAR